MSDSNREKARYIIENYCKHCSQYKPKQKNYCIISKNILVPLAFENNESVYSNWLFNHTSIKNRQCDQCDWKVD